MAAAHCGLPGVLVHGGVTSICAAEAHVHSGCNRRSRLADCADRSVRARHGDVVDEDASDRRTSDCRPRDRIDGSALGSGGNGRHETIVSVVVLGIREIVAQRRARLGAGGESGRQQQGVGAARAVDRQSRIGARRASSAGILQRVSADDVMDHAGPVVRDEVRRQNTGGPVVWQRVLDWNSAAARSTVARTVSVRIGPWIAAARARAAILEQRIARFERDPPLEQRHEGGGRNEGELVVEGVGSRGDDEWTRNCSRSCKLPDPSR